LFSAIAPIINALTPIISVLASMFSGVLGGAINAVMPLIQSVTDILAAVMDFITGVFTGNWEQAWNGVVNIFKGIFNLIPSIVESVINGAIGIINGIINGINKITGTIGIPAIPNIPEVSLPRFHAGGIVDFEAGEGLALLKSGEMVLTQAQQANLFAIANGENVSGGAYANPSFNISLKGDVYMDGLKTGRVVLRNLDDAAAFTLRG
jgi:hypothetical protein